MTSPGNERILFERIGPLWDYSCGSDTRQEWINVHCPHELRLNEILRNGKKI